MSRMAAPTSLRVATYNLYVGADLALLFDVSDLDELPTQAAVVRGQLDATRFAERATAVAAMFARERPDVVGLQEVCRWTSTPIGADGVAGAERVVVDFLPTLLDALESAGCGYDVHAVNENFGGAMPISASESVGLTGANVTLVRRDDRLDVVGERTSAYTASHQVVTGIDGLRFAIARSWGSVDLRVDGHPLRFVNTHTEAYDARVRGAQRDELLAHNADDSMPVVVVGDFNATPDAVGMPAPYLDAWAVAGTGDGFTWGQATDLANELSLLRERIDYVWAAGADVRDCRVIGGRPDDRTHPHRLWQSDHACVLADLAF